MEQEIKENIISYTSCVACAINVCCLICVLLIKKKKKVQGSLVNFQIASCIIHSIFNSYLLENFSSYKNFIETLVDKSFCLIELNFSFPEPGCYLIIGKSSSALLLSFLMMSIWIEIIYSIESVQLLKNPNSTFSLRHKFIIGFVIIILIAHLISNIIIVDNQKDDSWTYLAYVSLVLSTFYLLYAIYAYIIISKTHNPKSNMSRQISKITFIFLLTIILSSMCYFSLLISSLVYIINPSEDANLTVFILYSLQGVIASLIRTHHLIQNSGRLNQSNEGIESYSPINNEDSLMTSSITIKGTVKLLSKALDKASADLDANSILHCIQSNYLSECFYYMLKVILHISSNLNEKKNLVKTITAKEYSKRINHEIILGEETISQIISSEEEIPSFFKKIMDSLALFSKKIRITEYSPNVFHNIMLLDKLKYNVIEKSFNIESNISNICNYSGSEGKSGSIFFMTHDNKFLLKSIPEREYNSMYNGFLERYYNLITESNHSSLMRIYGTFQLNVGFNQMYFILMENIAPFPSSSFLFKFDLKGSTKGRQTKAILQKNQTLKDLDYLDLFDMDKASNIHIDDFKIDILKSIMDNDIKILYMSNLMDYSLFIGVLKNENIHTMTSKMFYSKNKKYVYCIGMIDFLTEYKNLKSLEHTLLSIFNKKNTISAIHPLQYSQRFIKFVFSKVLLKET